MTERSAFFERSLEERETLHPDNSGTESQKQGAGMRKRPVMPKWRPDEDAVLRQAWEAGESGSTIGRRLGRTRLAVLNRARALGLPHRDLPPGLAKTKKASPCSELTIQDTRIVALPWPKFVSLAPSRTCCWPLWPNGATAKHPKFGQFCNKPTVRGHSYCAEHAQLAFTKRIAETTTNE